MNKTFLEAIGLNEKRFKLSFSEGLDISRPGQGLKTPKLRSGMLCTARSGSSLLSVALQAYGYNFEEYLNRRGNVLNLQKNEQVDTVAKLASSLDRTAVVDGRFSTKIPPAALPYLFLMGEFPKNLGSWRFVYLRRQNLVRQAISGLIAQKTGQWTSRMTATAGIEKSDYSFTDILHGVEAASNGNRMIERFIGLFGLPVYNIVYEDLIENKNEAVRNIAIFLGANPEKYPNANAFKSWIESQSTDLNEEWECRFRNELRNRAIYAPNGTTTSMDD